MVETPAPHQLYGSPNALAEHYSRFRVGERLLFTGHSHQAWPDCGLEGQTRAWSDAAELVDKKWERAFAMAQRMQEGWQCWLGDDNGHIALGPNTHEMVVRLLSALPLRERPVIVTTDGEFHTLRRQLDRLGEAGIVIRKVASEPTDSLADRLVAALDDHTALVAVSAVMFRSAHIVPGLDTVAAACERVGAELLVDAYHALNVVPFCLHSNGLAGAFVVGGGYKYCQLGEGNCFLRIPPECLLRPIVTGWFSEFSALAEARPGRVAYGDGADRFAGATYDPTAHYRGAAVLDFFDRMELTPEYLRHVSQHQVGLLAAHFDDLDLDPAIVTRDRAVPLEQLAGFLALRSPHAERLCATLASRDVNTDYRDDILRFGPAPYLSDQQIGDAMTALGQTAVEISR